MRFAIWLISISAVDGKAQDFVWPKAIRPFFAPPAAFANDFGTYPSVLTFDDGRPVKTPADWRSRRAEILQAWQRELGAPPSLLSDPKIVVLRSETRDGLTFRRVKVDVAAGLALEGWLLEPSGAGPFPAALVVFYEPETSVGLKGKNRDFGLRLAQRGMITLSLGSPPTDAWKPDTRGAECQPLSFLAYIAANAHTALTKLPKVDPKRIAVVGHSYGGKWALFAAAFHEPFAALCVSDPGIVFDETRPNVNYWEPWYLGRDPSVTRKPGLPTPTNPRTGAYKRLVAAKRDLHEIHALIAPRPFLVSGGSEDPLERWQALNRSVEVNRLLGFSDRIGMTNRPHHDPTPESNAVIDEFFATALAAQPPNK